MYRRISLRCLRLPVPSGRREDASKGNRPSFSDAAPPAEAEPLYGAFCEALRELDVSVETGRFGARMAVELVNDGPVTRSVLELALGEEARALRAETR